MSKTATSADALFVKLSGSGKDAPKSNKLYVERQTPEEEKPTAKLSVSITPSMKQQLDDMVHERKKAGEKTSASDIVRQLLETVLED